MSPALANDGASAFVAFLVVLLAVMLATVIRLPGRHGSPASEEEDAGLQPAAAAPAAVQARAAATIARAAAVLPARPQQPGGTAMALIPAASQPRQAHYAARHAGAPVPREGTIPRPNVPGGPPWEPAPKPSGYRMATNDSGSAPRQ